MGVIEAVMGQIRVAMGSCTDKEGCIYIYLY